MNRKHTPASSAVNKKSFLSTAEIVYIGIFAALIAICSWISIPTAVPFTLQTFAVFLSCLVLGGRRGTVAVIVYILLGAAGLPVFSGFRGGLGSLLGTTGGYIIGFILTAFIIRAMENVSSGRLFLTALSLLLGLLACYALGTAWFMNVYGRATGPVSLMTVLGWCVFPFIVPDLVKIGLALTISSLLRQPLRRINPDLFPPA